MDYCVFDRGTEDWIAYCERLELYFTDNTVNNLAKQQVILLISAEQGHMHSPRTAKCQVIDKASEGSP